MKKVLYFMYSLPNVRVFESFKEREDLEQVLVVNGAEKQVKQYLYNFGIKNIIYIKDISEAQMFVNKYKPDIFVGSDINSKKIKLDENCRRVFVMHGFIPSGYADDPLQEHKIDEWKGFDLYCGAANEFTEWVNRIYPNSDNKDKILLNALPELDLLVRPESNKIKEKVIEKTGFIPEKILLYFPFKIKDDRISALFNEEFCWLIMALEELARKNNWLVMVKTKRVKNYNSKYVVRNFLKYIKDKKILAYKDKVNNILDSKFIYFIEDLHAYDYWFADAVIVNGHSSIEIMSCIQKKPLVLCRSTCKNDPYHSVSKNVAQVLYEKDQKKLEEILIGSIINNDILNKEEFVTSYHGIILDGNACKRIQDKFVKM